MKRLRREMKSWRDIPSSPGMVVSPPHRSACQSAQMLSEYFVLFLVFSLSRMDEYSWSSKPNLARA